tara:strand:+ start:200 stop:577 length:378 start_codon:yes stop_codon:yes gene_type:complete
MSSQVLTDTDEQTLVNLLEQVEEYIDDTNYERCAREVDNGFHYDYGSITNAWHSQPDIELNQYTGEFILDIEGVSDYVLNELTEACNYQYDMLSFSLNPNEDHDVGVTWHWSRVDNTVRFWWEVN